MSETSQSRLRSLESKLNSTRESAGVVGVSHNHIWLWRQLRADLTEEQLDKLEIHLYGKLANLHVLALRGGRKGAT